MQRFPFLPFLSAFSKGIRSIRRLRVNDPAVFSLFIICQWHIFRILFSIIYLTRSHAVTEHLFYIAKRHFYRLFHSSLRMIILPVLKMMLVSSLMMHPRDGISVYFPFFSVWASIPLIIFCSRDKFCRTVF